MGIGTANQSALLNSSVVIPGTLNLFMTLAPKREILG